MFNSPAIFIGNMRIAPAKRSQPYENDGKNAAVKAM